jgi:hypothetical protein
MVHHKLFKEIEDQFDGSQALLDKQPNVKYILM